MNAPLPPSTSTGRGPSAPPRIVAVTSGKGGVGKTVVSANLAAALARRGLSVLVLDADLGLANLDVVLNLQPRTTLHDVFTGEAAIDDAIVPAPGGFSALLAGSGLIEYTRLTPEVRDKLLAVLKEIAPRYDLVLLDTGAGISDVVLFTVSLADEVLLVVTPEPTSMTDAYATVKLLATQQARRPLRLVVNQVPRTGDGRTVANQLQQVVDRFVSPGLPEPVHLSLLGDVPLDDAVRDAMRKRQLVIESAPGSLAAQAITALAARLAP